MGYILPEIYKQIAKESGVSLPKVFIETGTFKGGIAHRCLETQIGLEDFDLWYTIEIDPIICQIASQRYRYFEQYAPFLPLKELMHTDTPDPAFFDRGKYFNRLELICGDSAIRLPQLLKKINQRACIWLDAHAGAAKYGGDPSDVPLYKELEALQNHHIKDHIIAIDDTHIFGTNQRGMCDYTAITEQEVARRVKLINDRYEVAIVAPFQMEMMIAYIKP